MPPVLLWLFLLLTPARATTMVVLDPVEHAASSTAIVEARVGTGTQVVDEHNGRTYTDTLLHVDQVLAGEAPTEVALRQMKGVRPDGGVLRVIGDAELVPGQRVVAFVVHHDNGHWYLTALSQSVWQVAAHGADPVVRRDFDADAMLQRDLDGTLRPVDQSFTGWGTLSELRAGVRDLTCGVTR